MHGVKMICVCMHVELMYFILICYKLWHYLSILFSTRLLEISEKRLTMKVM